MKQEVFKPENYPFIDTTAASFLPTMQLIEKGVEADSHKILASNGIITMKVKIPKTLFSPPEEGSEDDYAFLITKENVFEVLK